MLRAEQTALQQQSQPSPSPSGQPPVLLLNPASRFGASRSLRRLIERAAKGGRGELVVTNSPGQAEALAAAAAQEQRPVVAIGGDGTIAEVANGILATGQRVPLGIIPAGNGNDYALRALGLPRNAEQALELALTGTPLAMDVGEVNGRYFVNALGVGIDANIAAAATTLKGVPFLRGQMLYWAASMRELLLHYDRCPSLLVTTDGTTDERRLYALAAVSIGPTYGGGFYINPTADPRDGLFDVCAMWKPPLLRALRLLPRVEKGTHMGEPEVRHVRASSVLLEATRPIYAHLDGEVITAERFEAKVIPGALLVRQRVPAEQPA